jgi:hypothetical protein
MRIANKVVLFQRFKNRPVKQSPHLDLVEREMRRIGMGSFLGSDRRRLAEILDNDYESVSALGLTNEQIASRLEEITHIAKKQGEHFTSSPFLLPHICPALPSSQGSSS